MTTTDDPARFPRPDRTEPRGEPPEHPPDVPGDRLDGPVPAALALALVRARRDAWRAAHRYG